MQATNLFEEIQAKLSGLVAQSPVKDFERNVKAVLHQGFEKLDLATREQLDLQAELLVRTRAKLVDLEMRIAQLEAARSEPGQPGATRTDAAGSDRPV